MIDSSVGLRLRVERRERQLLSAAAGRAGDGRLGAADLGCSMNDCTDQDYILTPYTWLVSILDIFLSNYLQIKLYKIPTDNMVAGFGLVSTSAIDFQRYRIKPCYAKVLICLVIAKI